MISSWLLSTKVKKTYRGIPPSTHKPVKVNGQMVAYCANSITLDPDKFVPRDAVPCRRCATKGSPGKLGNYRNPNIRP